MFAEGSVDETDVGQNLGRIGDTLCTTDGRHRSARCRARVVGTYAEHVEGLVKVLSVVSIQGVDPGLEFCLEGHDAR